MKVRDIWERKDLPDAAGGELTTDPIDVGDSRFYLLTPAVSTSSRRPENSSWTASEPLQGQNVI